MLTFEIRPQGPFDLGAALDFVGGFSPGIGGRPVDDGRLVLAFPVEAPGWPGSAAVELRQAPDGAILARTDASPGLLDTVRRQAMRALSLDHDGSGWPGVGARDPLIRRLQEEHRFLRPVGFPSAFEAATSFVIGHRISRRQLAGIKARLSEAVGDRPRIDDVEVPAFPRPEVLLATRDVRGFTDEKLRRVHGLAEAAIEGRLDTERLRTIPRGDALRELQELPGVGAWTAEAILMRGCGVADEVPMDDEISREAVADMYEIGQVDDATWREISEAWRPYRMWATVLLRVAWQRRQGPMSLRRDPRRTRAG